MAIGANTDHQLNGTDFATTGGWSLLEFPWQVTDYKIGNIVQTLIFYAIEPLFLEIWKSHAG